MQKKRLGAHASILAVLLATVPSMGRAQGALPAPDMKSPKQVQVSVYYVDVAPAAFLKASRQIPAGQNHDALLLAALVKNGAGEASAPRVQTTDHVLADLDFVQKVPTTTAASPQGFLSLHNSVEVKPHCNADGTITVTLKTRRDELAPGVTPPTSTTRSLSMTRTFHDGQTLVLAGPPGATTTASVAHVIFAQVESRL